jgi:acetyl esterase/lipase
MTLALLACSPIRIFNAAISRSGYRIERDIPYGGDPRQKLDLYIPDGLKAPAPVILFFYGGSWQSGEKNYYLAFGEAFATKGIVVAIADYRLYPKVKYPAFVEDGALALRFMHDHVEQFGGDPSRIFVAGHSAGAYIAVMLASDLHYLAAVGGNIHWIRGVIGIAGPYDFLPLTDKNLIALFGGASRAETQPIHYIDGPRPPMLLVAGSGDTTVSPGNTERMAARLRAVGSKVETKLYPGVGHIGIILSIAPGFRFTTSLREDIVKFVAAH